jgi:hypothetical protein
MTAAPSDFDVEAFAELVRNMRDAQKRCLKSRKPEELDERHSLEREVDFVLLRVFQMGSGAG